MRHSRLLWSFERFTSKSSHRIAFIGTFLFLLVALHLSLPTMTITKGISRKDLGTHQARVVLIHQTKAKRAAAYRYQVDLRRGILPIHSFSLRASDCLGDVEIVRQTASEEKVWLMKDLVCPDRSQREFKIPPQFQDSDFSLRFVLTTLSEQRGFRLQSHLGLPFSLLWISIALAASFLLLHFLRFEARFIRYLLAAGLCFYLLNFMKIDVDKWAYDAWGHLDHVKTVLQGKLIPKDDCWECFQPPLAYWLAAVVSWISSQSMLLSVGAAARILSILSYCVFLYFGLKFLQLYCPREKEKVFLASFVVFLPVSLIHALRVGNEPLFYAFFMAALYYLARIDQSRNVSSTDLRLFSWMLVGALFTKATALILYPIGATLLFLRRKKLDSARTLCGSLSPAVFALPVYALFQEYKGSLVERLDSLNSQLKISSSAVNILGVDLKDLLKNPFVDPWKDAGGRSFFFNYYYKSLSWGEFNWGRELSPWALSWNLLWVIALVMILMGVWKGKATAMRRELSFPLLLLAFCFFTSFLYRVFYPYSVMQDFRFLFPVIFPLSVVMTKSFSQFSWRFVKIYLWSVTGLLTLIWYKVLFS